MKDRFFVLWYQKQARHALQKRRIGFGLACLKKLALVAPHRAVALVLEAALKILVPLSLRNRLTLWFKKSFKVTPSFYRRAKEFGLNIEPRGEKVVVSLTSYPKRIGTIHKVINTLLTQTYKPDIIVLWLAPEQFPNREADLPRELLALKKYGLTIDWYHDIRSFKKLIPALKKFPESCIVTVDDDVYYPPSWLDLLVKCHLKHSDAIVCHKAHRVEFDGESIAPYRQWSFARVNAYPSYNYMQVGEGGVLYPPRSMYGDVCNEACFMKCCPSADDIWFWIMSLLNETRIKVVDNGIREVYPIFEADNTDALCALNMMTDNRNDMQLKSVINRYPQVLGRFR